MRIDTGFSVQIEIDEDNGLVIVRNTLTGQTTTHEGLQKRITIQGED
jgi:hypothetical protein